jgi:hypothetical protein
LRAAARRLGTVLGALTVATAVPALVIGLVAGASVGRALSVGWYGVGCVLLLSGFFVGNRGPARPQGEGWSVFSLNRWVRWATPEEQRESISLSALLVILGFVLIVFGALVDPHNSIV